MRLPTRTPEDSHYGWTPDLFFKQGYPKEVIALFTAIASCANRKQECWPSIITLSQRSGCSRATIHRHMPTLVADGWIEVTPPGTAGNPHKTNLYRLTKSPKLSTELSTGVSEGDTEGSERDSDISEGDSTNPTERHNLIPVELAVMMTDEVISRKWRGVKPAYVLIAINNNARSPKAYAKTLAHKHADIPPYIHECLNFPHPFYVIMSGAYLELAYRQGRSTTPPDLEEWQDITDPALLTFIKFIARMESEHAT